MEVPQYSDKWSDFGTRLGRIGLLSIVITGCRLPLFSARCTSVVSNCACVITAALSKSSCEDIAVKIALLVSLVDVCSTLLPGCAEVTASVVECSMSPLFLSSCVV
jgi:hypothetical protein